MKIPTLLRKLVITAVALLSITGCSGIFVRKSSSHSRNVSSVTFDKDTYPAVVLGGGVGGMTASVYLAMANIKTLLVQGPVAGGLLTQSLSVRNWPGEIEATGFSIADKLLAQARKQGVEVHAEKVLAVDTSTWPYTITLSDVLDSAHVRTVKALSVVVGMGAFSNYLGISGEKEYWSRGVTNCAVCEGSLYKDGVVCVVGGGNSAIEEAHYLAGIARKVYVFVRGSSLRATDNRKDELTRMKNVEIVYNHSLQKIAGDGSKVVSVAVMNNVTREVKEMAMDGVFLAIGFKPNTAMFKGVLDLTPEGYIALTNDQQTSVTGVYAVGDICDPVYKQAVTAAGDGCRAALQAYSFLKDCGYTPAHSVLEKEPVAVEETPQKAVAIAAEPVGLKTDAEEKALVPPVAVPEEKEEGFTPGVVHEIRSPQEIAELIESGKPVVIDFYATWCGPCRAMSPMYKRLAATYTGKATFVKVNIDDLGGFATEYRVRGVPTFAFIKESVEVDRIVGGGSTEKQFAEKIDAIVG